MENGCQAYRLRRPTRNTRRKLRISVTVGTYGSREQNRVSFIRLLNHSTALTPMEEMEVRSGVGREIEVE